MKRLIAFCTALLSLITLCGCNVTVTIDTEPQATEKSAKQTEAASSPTGELTVHYIDVGQGDAILIRQGEAAMLIDAGENDRGNQVVSYLEQLGIERLDYVIGTHPHSDHIGGLDNVISAFDIGQVIMPKVSHTTKTYKDVLSAVQKKGLSVTGAKAGQTYKLGNATAEILSPIKDKYEDLNEYSVVLRLTFGKNRFLFTGDMESYNEKEMLNAGTDVSADVYKVAHHGSYTSNTEEFLEAVGATCGVIPVGEENEYGHPHTNILRRLTQMMTVYRTDRHGTVIITSNGTDITVKTEKGGK